MRIDVAPPGLPDGGIFGQDVNAVVAQFGDNCPDTGHFFYNGDGLRMQKWARPAPADPMQRTDYVWDTGAALPVILEEEINNSSGTPLVTFHYVYGLDLIARIEDAPSNPQAFYLHDGLGSVRTLTNASGNPNNTYDYDAFGKATQTGSSGQGFRFTGEYQDQEVANDLYYLRARYYDPAIGRFWSRDPLASIQRYAYVRNNPARYVDPAGLCVGGAPCPGPIDTARDWVRGRTQDIGSVAAHTLAHPANLFNGNLINQFGAFGISAFSSCKRNALEGGAVLYEGCRGLAGWISSNITGGRTYTIGSFIFSGSQVTSEEVLQHELAHVAQYDVLGGSFLPVYGALALPAWISCGFDVDCAAGRHPLEQLADWQADTGFY